MDSVSLDLHLNAYSNNNNIDLEKNRIGECVGATRELVVRAPAAGGGGAQQPQQPRQQQTWGMEVLRRLHQEEGSASKEENNHNNNNKTCSSLAQFVKRVLNDVAAVDIVAADKKVVDVLCDDIGSGFSDENAFYVVDLGVVCAKVELWHQLIPRARPHFALKSNPCPVVSKLLATFNLGFDCASRAEIMQVLAMGVSPADVIYANPCKQSTMLQWVSKSGVRRMTFDNAAELHKIKLHCPTAQLILRIAVDDSQSTCKFNSKFGARAKDIPVLLREARKLELDVIGVSFHVGSGCQSASVFPDAIRLARGVFDTAIEMGFQMTLLDIGGGFPGHEHGNVTFHAIAAAICPALDEFFPEDSGVEIIAEPGRFFVSESHSLATTVIAKRRFIFDNAAGGVVMMEEDEQNNSNCDSKKKLSPPASPTLSPSSPTSTTTTTTTSTSLVACAAAAAAAMTTDDGPQVAYYINDGVYGSFNCIMFDHAIVTPVVLMTANTVNVDNTTPSKLFGPTCDSMDCVMQRVDLPDLEVGDWLYFPNMGAYTRAAASAFNGFRVPDCHFILPATFGGSE